MNPEAQRVRDLFVAAVKLPPDQWKAFLEEACAGDDELRGHVSDLLREHQQAGSFLDRPAAHLRATGDFDPAANGAVAAPEGPGVTIGPYKLLELIGEGGMGAVWMAEQRQPVQRKVALKIIKAGMGTRQVIARFEAERQALALMEHPNIAKVFDGGTTNSGRPYFVMELVKGIPISKYCDEHCLTPRERLELFLPVCQAIQHAHQKGIIHRDVKPANVLVAPYDGVPVPKVIDFGVAKATGQRLTERTLFTGFGAVVGTLEYMSPEQAELNNHDIDTRSDIYSLGVLLYELLTGTTPLTHERLKQAAFTEMLRAIREEEPPRPSTRLSESKDSLPSIAAQRHMEPAKLTKLVHGELDWIVMKALEKDRRRRYETANGLARDVERYLADEPVQACPPSTWYRVGKFARRNRARLAIAGLALLLIVLLGGGGGWLAGNRAARQREAEGKALEALEAAGPRLREGHPWDPALVSAAQRVEAELDGGLLGPQVRRRAEQLRHDVRMLAELDEIRLRQAESKEGAMFDVAGTEARYAAAFSAYGIDVAALDPTEAAARIRDSAIREALVAGLDGWMRVKPDGLDPPEQERMFRQAVEHADRARLRAVADGADDSAWRRAFRAAALARDVRELKALAGQAEALDQPPGVLAGLGSVLADAGLWKEAEAVLRQAQARHPGDFWINYNLGHLLHFCPTPRNTEAVGYLRAAVAIRPTSAEARSMLGHALFHGGDRDKGIAGYQQAIALDPKFAVARFNLAGALAWTGRLNEAIAEYREVIRLVKDFPEGQASLGNALGGVAEVLLRQGKHAEAAKVGEEMVSLPRDNGSQRAALLLTRCAELAEKDEKLPGADRKAAARTYADRSRELQQNAREAYARAITAAERLVSESPEVARYREQLTEQRTNLVALLKAMGRTEEAENTYRRAITFYSQLAAAHPDMPELWDARARGHYDLGQILQETGQRGEADKAYRQALAIWEKKEARAVCWAARRERARAYANVGLRQLELQNYPESEKAYRRAVRLMEELAGERPDDFDNAYDLASTYHGFYRPYGDSGRLQPAEEKIRHALALFEKLAADFPDRRPLTQENRGYCQRNLALVLQRAGKPQEAEKAFRQALRIWTELAAGNPKYWGYPNALAYDYGLLGDLFHETGQLSRAIDAWREGALLLEELAAETHNPDIRWALAGRQQHLGSVLENSGRPQEAEKWYRAAVSSREKLVAETKDIGHLLHLALIHQLLGQFLKRTGRLQEAINAYQEATPLWQKLVAEFPNNAEYRSGLLGNLVELAEDLLQQGKHAEAAQVAEKMAAALPKDANGHQHAAAVLARCVPLAEKDAKLSATDRPSLVQAYAKRSSELMLQALRVAANPDAPQLRDAVARSHRDLAQIFQKSGQVNEAEKAYRQAIDLLEKLVDERPADFDQAGCRAQLNSDYSLLGELLQKSGKRENAEEQFRKALKVSENLTAEFPTKSYYWLQYTDSAQRLSRLLAETGRPKDAEQTMRLTIVRLEKFAADFRALSPIAREHGAYCLRNLAGQLQATGRAREAERILQQSVATWTALVAANPKSAGYRNALAHDYGLLGNLYHQTGEFSKASTAWREAEALWKKLAAELPGELSYQSELAHLDWHRGNLLKGAGKPQEAEEAYRRALRIFEKLTGARGAEPFFFLEHAGTYCLLADLWRDTGRAEEAAKAYRQALALHEKFVAAYPAVAQNHFVHGGIHSELGQWHKAAAEFAKVLELEPDRPWTWYLWALVRLGAADTKGYRDTCTRFLERFGKTEDADAAYWVTWCSVLGPDAVAQPALLVPLAEKGLAKASTNYDCLNTLGAALYRAGQFEEAVKRLGEAAGAYKPEAGFRTLPVYNWFFLAMAHHRLGHSDESQKWLDKAVQWMDQAEREKGEKAASKVPMPWNRRLTLQLLRREAETLIHGAARKK